jgi:hypothetical protein
MLRIRAQYDKVIKELSDFNISSLGDFHALSSGMKAIFTWDTMSFLDTCRQCLGG